MTTSYPGGIDAFTNPDNGAGDTLDSIPHDDQHANANDAIEAIENELGTDPSGVAASVKARIENVETDAAAAQAAADAAQVTADDALPVAGGTMTGDLILDHDPAVDLEAATKAYVDEIGELNGYITTSVITSVLPVLSDAKAWYDTRFGVLPEHALQDLAGRDNHLELITDDVNGPPQFLGHTGADYLWMPGWDDMWLDTPAPTGLLDNDFLDIRWAANLEVNPYGTILTDGTKNTFVHQGTDDDSDVSWAVRWNNFTSELTFLLSDDGTAVVSVQLGASGDSSMRRAITLEYATGEVRLYEQSQALALAAVEDDLSEPTWVLTDTQQIGAPFTPFASTADIRISSTSGRYEVDGDVADGGGAIQYLAVRDNENGAVLAGFFAREITFGAWNVVGGYPPVGGQDEANETTFDGLAAETWTAHIMGTSSMPIVLVDRPLVIFEKKQWGETPVDDEVFDVDTGVLTVAMLTRDSRPDLGGNQFFSHKDWTALHDAAGYEGLHTSFLPGGVSSIVSDGTDQAVSTPDTWTPRQLVLTVIEVDFDGGTTTAWTNGVASTPASLASVSPTSSPGIPFRVAMMKDSGSNKTGGTFEFMALALFHRALSDFERDTLLPAELGAAELITPAGGSPLHADLTDTDTDGHPADIIDFTPAGSIVATDVQAAIEELDATPAVLGMRPSLKSGDYARCLGALNGTTLTALKCYWMPLDLERDISVDRIGTYISGGGGVGTVLRFMIYGDTDGVPDTLILDAGTVNANSTGPAEVTISQALDAGRVWLAMVSDGTPSVAAFQFGGVVGANDLTEVTNTGKSCYTATLASTAAPSPAPAVSYGPLTAPLPAVRVV